VIAKQGTIVWKADHGRPVTLLLPAIPLQRNRRSDRQGDVGVLARNAHGSGGWSRTASGSRSGPRDPRTGKASSGICSRPARQCVVRAATAGRRSGEWHSVRRGLKFGNLEVAKPRFPFFVSMNSAAAPAATASFVAVSAVSPSIGAGNRGSRPGQHRRRWRAHSPTRHTRRRGRQAASLSSALRRPRAPQVRAPKEVGIRLRPAICLEIRSLRRRRLGATIKRSTAAHRHDHDQGLTEVPTEERN
jgi:hypothetical protein